MITSQKTPLELARKKLGTYPSRHLKNWWERWGTKEISRGKGDAQIQELVEAAQSEDVNFGRVSDALRLLTLQSLAFFRLECERNAPAHENAELLKQGLAYSFWKLQLQWAFDQMDNVGHETWSGFRGGAEALTLMLFALSADCPEIARWAASHFISTVECGNFTPHDIGVDDLESWCFVTTLASCVARKRWLSVDKWPEYDSGGLSRLGQYQPLLNAMTDSSLWFSELERYCDTRLAHSSRHSDISSSKKKSQWFGALLFRMGAVLVFAA